MPTPATSPLVRDFNARLRPWIQGGFAGIVALVFLFLVWVTISQLQTLQHQLADQAREERVMFREELKSQRDELRAAVQEMRRAVDRLDDSQRAIKADVHTLKFAGPEAFKAPPPRAKPMGDNEAADDHEEPTDLDAEVPPEEIVRGAEIAVQVLSMVTPGSFAGAEDLLMAAAEFLGMYFRNYVTD